MFWTSERTIRVLSIDGNGVRTFTQTVAISYLDDVLVPAKTFEDMLQRLSLVFAAVMKAKLTFKLSKCEFAKQEVKFLGFRLTGESLQPGETKTKAIEKFSEPKNKHEVRRFL